MYPIAEVSLPPKHQDFDPDDVIAFHAARILLLILVCGGDEERRAIDGSTKLAKLDFFIRYPRFLERAQESLRFAGEAYTPYEVGAQESVEAPMIRYRFGPWDPRYRQYIAFLEARELVRVAPAGRSSTKLALTAAGRRLAERLAGDPAFSALVRRAEVMRSNLATWSGSELKTFIYRLLATEVGELALWQTIRE